MYTYTDLIRLGLEARDSYRSPPTDQCYEVCCDLADLLVQDLGVAESSVRVMSLYLNGSSSKHYIVELSGIDMCDSSSDIVLLDPTIDQFCQREKEKGNVGVSLGENLPRVGVYSVENHPY
jgi:hypothetical protein